MFTILLRLNTRSAGIRTVGKTEENKCRFFGYVGPKIIGNEIQKRTLFLCYKDHIDVIGNLCG